IGGGTGPIIAEFLPGFRGKMNRDRAGVFIVAFLRAVKVPAVMSLNIQPKLRTIAEIQAQP
ncbi:MAG: hypothetical protein WA199_02660, partial [Xanthobacteraceae bacterium]